MKKNAHVIPKWNPWAFLTFFHIFAVSLIQNTKKYELIKFPYEANALEPVISKETLAFHHGKHLNAYVNNLNGLIEGTK